MIRKLRILCPLCIICLVVLVFSVFGLDTQAVSDDNGVDEAVVTYSADSWSASGMTEAATAQETSAAQTENTYVITDSDEVAVQEYQDSGYELSDSDRIRVECIVMCEAGGEGEKGQMMVAQCILEGLLRYDYTLDEYIKNYKVKSTSYDNVTDEVRNSVSRVFDNGERVTEAKADLWYNPALTQSAWHEAQEYVITVGNHRFFWMIDANDNVE